MKWSFFKKKEQREYGTCNNRPARRHKKKGNVQFILWKAGETVARPAGLVITEDYWYDFHSSWWSKFEPKK